MRRFDLIAFDWDGTLFDSTALITRCIQEAVRDVGGTVPSAKAASYVIGMALMPALAHAAPDVPKEQFPLLNERYRHHYLEHQDDLSLFDGILDLLGELRQRQHFLAVATGKSRAGLNHVLERVELHDLFHATRTADETAGKPNPLMMRSAMRYLGVHSENTVMVGDRMDTDVVAGVMSGLETILVMSGVSTPKDVERFPYRPGKILNSVADIEISKD